MQLDETPPRAVLAQFPQVPRGNLVELGNYGGFSGARLWRLETPQGDFCIKAYPNGWRSGAELAWIHSLLCRVSHWNWLPHVSVTARSTSFVETQGRFWEITTWLPGTAEFHQQPSYDRLRSAMTSLAQLHDAWRIPSQRGICPAVLRRVDSWKNWTQLIQSGWGPRFAPLDPYEEYAQQLWRILQHQADDLPRLLSAWLERDLPLQPCVCDLWHDHMLFTGAQVTGIVDFGSVKIDHVAVDLARLLGSLIGNDRKLWNLGFSAHAAVGRPLSDNDIELAFNLDRTGLLVAATNWLRWLYLEGRVHPQPAAVRARLAALVQRLAS